MSTFFSKMKKIFVIFCMVWTAISIFFILFCVSYMIYYLKFPPKFQSVPNEQSVESFIYSRNGKCVFSGKYRANNRHIISVSFEDSDIDDEDILQLRTLNDLNHIKLIHTKVTATGIKKLGEMPNLRYIEYNDEVFLHSLDDPAVLTPDPEIIRNQPYESTDSGGEETQDQE